MDGVGAAAFGGRWNSVGRRVVYASLGFGGALIEQLVHAGIGRLPPRVYVTIVIPSGVQICELSADALRGWDDDSFAVSRRAGHVWLDASHAVACITPSKAAAPFERNVLINPAHAAIGSLRISKPRALVWDDRLHKHRIP